MEVKRLNERNRKLSHSIQKEGSNGPPASLDRYLGGILSEMGIYRNLASALSRHIENLNHSPAQTRDFMASWRKRGQGC